VESTLWGDSETKRHCSVWLPNWNRQGHGSTRDLPWLNRRQPGNPAAEGLGVKGVPRKYMSNLRIPLPPLEVQKKIVAEIEFERELVEVSKKLIEIFEKKIKDKIGEVWGE